MNDQEIKELIRQVRDAAEEGVTAALERVGINSDDPLEVQRDMAFVRDWRTATASIKRKSLLAGVGVLVAGSLGVLWLGVKELLS